MGIKSTKPRALVGAVADDLIVVSALAEILGRTAEVVAWTEDVFTLSEDALKNFQRVLETADCSVFIASTQARKTAGLSPNLIVEIGMSVGYLGGERTALLLHEDARVEIPSGLRGLSVFKYGNGSDVERLRESLAPVASQLRRWIRDLGFRAARSTERAEPNDVVLEVSTKREAGPLISKPAADRTRRNSVFISYAHADAKWLAKIKTMLTPLVRADRISVWDDTRIKPGSKWHGEIERALKSAKVALLLVSPNFLASPFIADEELPPILNAAQDDGLVIVWALISACLYKKTPIADYQAAHPIAKPLDALPAPKRNQALLAIAETIGSTLES